MAKKGNNPTISAFTGLKYINAILSLVEEISNQPLYEQRISPKFIYRGITKRYISKARLYEDNDNIEFLRGLYLWDENNNTDQTYINIQKYILSSAGNSIASPEDYLNKIYRNDLYRFIIPEEIRSGASIRLYQDNKDGKDTPKITSAYYIQYVKNLISEVKNTYPSFNNLSDLEILAELQHKGAASCLVDFSQNILISLWFATQKDPEDFGYLFLYDINADVFMHNNIEYISRDNCEENIETLLLKTKQTASYVEKHKARFWSWRPTSLNSRIARQDSIFIFGMEPFIVKDHNIRVIPIIPSWKSDIQSALKTFFGLTAETIYPDSDGLALSHSKSNSISPTTSYLNPYFNAGFNDFETLQSGISNLMKGEYSIALNLFHHFEGINNKLIIDSERITLNSSIANIHLILIELYYSIAKCYHKLNKLWRAEEYYRKAFSLVYTCYSEIGLDTNLERCDILIPQTVKNIYSEGNVKDYLRSTICKITDNYIDVLYDIRDYDKAIKVIELLEILEEHQVTCLKEILHTVKISIYILQKLYDKHDNKLVSFIQNNKIRLCHIANSFFELVVYSTDHSNDIFGIKAMAEKVAKLLEALPNNDEYGYLSWNFSDIRQAINKKFAENRNVLLILESTLAKIENYQEITYHRRYNR